MANNSLLATSELDFETLKKNLKSYLSGQSSLVDYDFEGSNMAVLIDLLAYNTFMNAQYMNMVASEMFLDTAQIKESVVSHAKELNYVPRSRISSRLIADVTITPNDNPSTITIPKYYPIRTTKDGITYNFITDAPVVIKNEGGNFIANNVTFYEGELVTEIFTANVVTNNDGTFNSYSYPLSSENIDTNSIEVVVENSSTDNTLTTFSKAENFFGVTSTSNKFFVEGYAGNRYKIVFGNGVIGKSLKNGNRVTVRYRDTVGSAANKAYNFSYTSDIEGYSGISLSVLTSSYGGADRESISDIKYSAPRHFQTQERAVTIADYKTLTLNKFPQLQAVTAYGGEDASPKQYGKVIIAVKPYGSIGVITDSLKNQIVEFLKLKSLTTEPIITDPEYFYVEINSDVYYDPKLTTESANDLKSQIVTNLVALNNTLFNDFGKDVLYSRIVRAIDNTTENDIITSNDTSLRMIYRWTPTLNANSTVMFSYDNVLANEGTRYLYPEGHEKVFQSSSFVYTSNGVDYVSFISDDGLGNIRIYTIDDGTEIVLKNNIGTVDYDTGDITFTTAVKSYTSRINLYAKLENKNIDIRKNKFLILDSSDLNINMVAVTDE